MTIVKAIAEVLRGDTDPQTVEEIFNRIVSKSLYAFKAADPKSVVRSQLRRHCVGLDFPTASPVKYFRLVDGDRYALESEAGVRTVRPKKPAQRSELLPEELIEDAHDQHVAGLRQALKNKILENHPAFFERLVIELLIKMGYGGSDPTLGIHTGGPGDGGIDGIINEDRLGLEKIYIQAKRYAFDREVKPGEVRGFAGAMNKAKKGVFITTGLFAKSALSVAASHKKNISLIDGDQLCNLMISYGVGVSEVKTYRVLKVDNDYFSTEA